MVDRDWFVGELINRLVEKEFCIVLSTSSTGSHYLELDMSMGIRVRVSDHPIGRNNRVDVSVQPYRVADGGEYEYVRLSKSRDAVSRVVSLACERRQESYMKIGYARYKRHMSRVGAELITVSEPVLSIYGLFGERLYRKELISRIKNYKLENKRTGAKIFCAI